MLDVIRFPDGSDILDGKLDAVISSVISCACAVAFTEASWRSFNSRGAFDGTNFTVGAFSEAHALSDVLWKQLHHFVQTRGRSVQIFFRII